MMRLGDARGVCVVEQSDFTPSASANSPAESSPIHSPEMFAADLVIP